MAHWRLKQTRRGSRRLPPAVVVEKQVEGRPPVVLGTCRRDIHGTLIDVAGQFAPGDVIETPEGVALFNPPPRALPRN